MQSAIRTVAVCVPKSVTIGYASVLRSETGKYHALVICLANPATGVRVCQSSEDTFDAALAEVLNIFYKDMCQEHKGEWEATFQAFVV